MAISNFTKTFLRSVFPASLIPAGLRSTYKKLSYIILEKLLQKVVLSAENFAALRMLERTYKFKHLDSNYERLVPLGVCRVVSVVIKSDGHPEIGLLFAGDDCPTYCRFSDLIVQHEVFHFAV